MRGIYEKIRGNESYSNQIFSAADYYAQESLNELSSSFSQEEISQTVFYLTVGKYFSGLKRLFKSDNLDELFRNSREISIKDLKNTKGTVNIIKGDVKTAEKIFESFKRKGWEEVTTESARKKGISVIQSPNGKEKLQFRKFSSSKTKDGEEFEATFDLIKKHEINGTPKTNKREIKFLNK